MKELLYHIDQSIVGAAKLKSLIAFQNNHQGADRNHGQVLKFLPIAEVDHFQGTRLTMGEEDFRNSGLLVAVRGDRNRGSLLVFIGADQSPGAVCHQLAAGEALPIRNDHHDGVIDRRHALIDLHPIRNDLLIFGDGLGPGHIMEKGRRLGEIGGHHIQDARPTDAICQNVSLQVGKDRGAYRQIALVTYRVQVINARLLIEDEGHDPGRDLKAHHRNDDGILIQNGRLDERVDLVRVLNDGRRNEEEDPVRMGHGRRDGGHVIAGDDRIQDIRRVDTGIDQTVLETINISEIINSKVKI